MGNNRNWKDERSSANEWHKHYEFGGAFGVTAHMEKDVRDEDWMPATVSWPSIGAVTPDEAETFALAMLKAAIIARKWNEETQMEAANGNS